jgi:hypothetical protein
MLLARLPVRLLGLRRSQAASADLPIRQELLCRRRDDAHAPDDLDTLEGDEEATTWGFRFYCLQRYLQLYGYGYKDSRDMSQRDYAAFMRAQQPDRSRGDD